MPYRVASGLTMVEIELALRNLITEGRTKMYCRKGGGDGEIVEWVLC